MAEATERYGLPLLQAGQSQKEITHNDAVVRMDALMHPSVESRSLTAPPASPTPGQTWIVGNGASGDWAGHDGAIAAFQAGGWTFIVPSAGCTAWMKSEGVFAVFSSGVWSDQRWPIKGLSLNGIAMLTDRQPAIVDPSGGTTIDAEARLVLGQILATLRSHGLIGV